MTASKRNVEQRNHFGMFDWYFKDPSEGWVSVSGQDHLNRLFDEGRITLDTLITWSELGEPGFPYRYIEAEFFYIFGGIIQHAYTEAELHSAAIEGRVTSSTIIWGRKLPAKGIQYGSYQFIDVTFVPDITEFLEARRGRLSTVLSGPNNSGKTLALKLIRRELGPTANFLACNRFYHIDHLTPVAVEQSQHRRRHENFITQLYQQRQNTENNDFPLPEVISQMKDRQRDSLFLLCTELLGEVFGLKRIDVENTLSQHYVDVGGHSLAIASTGTRLLMIIVAACLDDRYNALLLDEPELGLSPRLQGALARYLLDSERRGKYFPHLTQLFVATHSHLYLDRGEIGNNFAVLRDGTSCVISQVKSMSAFHDLQFSMLGNTLEALFLPAAIVIVEGETDHDYVKRVIKMFLPDKRVSVVRSNGEGDTKNQLHTINSSLGDSMMSPYRHRVFLLLDSIHTFRKRDAPRLGIPDENVVVLDRNGIEYYYPERILGDIFACEAKDVHSLLAIDGNTVRVYDIVKTKKALCQEVLDRLTPETEIPAEFQEKLLSRIEQLLA